MLHIFDPALPIQHQVDPRSGAQVDPNRAPSIFIPSSVILQAGYSDQSKIVQNFLWMWQTSLLSKLARSWKCLRGRWRVLHCTGLLLHCTTLRPSLSLDCSAQYFEVVQQYIWLQQQQRTAGCWRRAAAAAAGGKVKVGGCASLPAFTAILLIVTVTTILIVTLTTVFIGKDRVGYHMMLTQNSSCEEKQNSKG